MTPPIGEIVPIHASARLAGMLQVTGQSELTGDDN